MKTLFSKITILIIISILIFSCKDDVKLATVNPLKLKEFYAAGAKVEIWGKKNFFMGFNNLTVILLDSVNTKDTLKDAHIYFKPEMTMVQTVGMPMVHSCPVENPAEDAINGVFQGAVAFVMPSSSGNTWKLGVYIHNHKNGKSATTNFDVNVDNPTTSVMHSFIDSTANASKLFLSILQPLTPKVGVNDIEFTLHKKVGMMEWPADTTYTVEINPSMPSMGHGSPNNVNPVHFKNGHYKGKVNFTMTGDWKIGVIIKKGTTVISSDKYFNISL